VAHNAPVISVEAARARSRGVREISALRARRAARLSAEAAAARRRMLLVAVAGLATLILAGSAAATSLSWIWPVVPFALGLATIVFSRACAVRSQRMGEEEVAQLHRLRDQLSRSTTEAKVTVQAEAVEAKQVAEASDSLESEEAGAEGAAEAPLEEVSAQESTDAQVSVASEIQEEVPAPVERRTWTPAVIPAPTYAMRARLSGRIVHPDTDIRGIPRVDARIPARPIAAGPVAQDARSTEEVVAFESVVLDVEAALDSRIAQ